ncbi:MAG: thiamine pyrophosphate-dependent dehydrogenase E1 component subunit alpha [Sedimentisphaerales bacterium]|nr:thiamine pyrophosphate-dependent dehydrogenase E1 component subunit alpha [Sedimentisphaerales bacterium]
MKTAKKNTSVFVQMYQLMKKIRITEEAIANRYSQWKMRCPTHLCSGQEAVAAAVGTILRKDDFVVSMHRAHGHYLGKGGNLKKMLAEIHGKAGGCSGGKGGSMHLTDKSVNFMGSTAIVGGTIPIGVGLGLSIKLGKSNQVSVVFLGDGATEEGVFYESVNFAAVKKLPVLFICENNLYSVYSPLSVRQPVGRKISEMVNSIGIESEHGDGNNAGEVYDKIRRAVDAIRKDGLPRFLEFATYRWREHCGPNFDNDIGYRTEEEFESWKRRDPIVLFEEKLLTDKAISKKMIEKIEADIQKEVDEAFDYAASSDFPADADAFDGLYKN